ncbi:MAG: ABC transporter permease, partial [Desulfofustis sp.]|nr:ABC transporter permease [Desulfofustis sp.]
MIVYLSKRLLMMIPMLIGITLISFVVIHLAPGEPTDLQTDLNPEASLEMKERLRAQYDLDKPLHVQYGKWLSRLVQLDFGDSFSQDRRPVLDKIAERLPITILINVLSIALILAVSVPIGILSAVKRNSPFDRGTTVFVFLGFAMPSFWLALLLMETLGVQYGLVPISGIKSLG